MVNIATQHNIGRTEVFGQFEVADPVVIFFPEFRLHNAAALWQEGACFAIVTIVCTCIFAILSVYKGGNTFVDC